MHAFSWMNFDWVELSAPPECIGSFSDRLLFVAFAPLVVLTLVAGSSAAYGGLLAYQGARMAAADSAQVETVREGMARGLLRALPLVLAVLFALVPMVSARIFSSYSCKLLGSSAEHGSDYSVLHADYSVVCGSDEHERIIVLANCLVVLWPVGVSVLFAAVLLAGRWRPTWASSLWHSAGFLHHEYRARFFYWVRAPASAPPPCGPPAPILRRRGPCSTPRLRPLLPRPTNAACAYP